MKGEDVRRAYWRKNLSYLGVLLGIWFLVSYVCGILLVDRLDHIRIAGFKLGFWFAQQGSIYTFVLIILAYVLLMNRLDARYRFDERDPRTGGDREDAAKSADAGEKKAEAGDGEGEPKPQVVEETDAQETTKK